VAEQTPEAKIRDLERRLDLDPGSRLFVALAEEYRKLGRMRDALGALQKGLLAHPGYVAAQVALGRVYVEAGQATDAVATFTKVLVADPGNLVAAKSLADIYLARGDKLEAVKKYKLYRALSGDRKVDSIIADLETQVAPKPVAPPRIQPPVEPPPPPPKFQETDKSRRRPIPKPLPSVVADEGPFDIAALPFELGDDSGKEPGVEEPFLVPTRDVPIAPRPSGALARAQEPARPTEPPRFETPPPGSMAVSSPQPQPIEPAPAPVLAFPAPPAAAAPLPPAADLPEPAAPVYRAPEQESKPEPARPSGRALADLYYAQGHYAEALQIYDDLVSRHPFDQDLMRMRRDAEARLLPAGSTPGSAADPGLERRLAMIRRLKHWLAAVQAG
jgi:tetratricopeptide (TPR) repeat protein